MTHHMPFIITEPPTRSFLAALRVAILMKEEDLMVLHFAGASPSKFLQIELWDLRATLRGLQAMLN